MKKTLAARCCSCGGSALVFVRVMLACSLVVLLMPIGAQTAHASNELEALSLPASDAATGQRAAWIESVLAAAREIKLNGIGELEKLLNGEELAGEELLKIDADALVVIDEGLAREIAETQATIVSSEEGQCVFVDWSEPDETTAPEETAGNNELCISVIASPTNPNAIIQEDENGAAGQAGDNSSSGKTDETAAGADSPDLPEGAVAPPSSIIAGETTAGAETAEPRVDAPDSPEGTKTSTGLSSESLVSSTQRTSGQLSVQASSGGLGNQSSAQMVVAVLPNPTTEEFIRSIGPQARVIAQQNDLYASVMIAQAIVESGSGSSQLSKAPYNNLFGIKGAYKGQSVTFPTQEDDGTGSHYSVEAEFRSYPNVSASLQDYADLLTKDMASYYAPVRRSNAATYIEACDYLQGHYATSTTYSKTLQSIILTYNLTSYDGAESKPQLDVGSASIPGVSVAWASATPVAQSETAGISLKEPAAAEEKGVSNPFGLLVYCVVLTLAGAMAFTFASGRTAWVFACASCVQSTWLGFIDHFVVFRSRRAKHRKSIFGVFGKHAGGRNT